MKKKLIRTICAATVLAVLFSFSSIAFADKPYSDSDGGTLYSGSSDDTSAREMLKMASNYKEIELPKSSDYFPEYFSMYIDAPKEHSVYVYKAPAAKESTRFDTAFHGSRVYVVAEHDDLLCLLYFTKDYKLRAGWVNVDNLNSEYPCETYYPPRASRAGTRGTYNFGDPLMSWSKIHYPGTKSYYSVLNAPVDNCVEFTLDYQVTSRNGSQTKDILGDRDILVYDGEKWIKMGTIDYDEYKPCHIRVTMESPITLYAVATISHCNSTSYIYRQIVIDVICER